jgi:hypothetical protein
MRSDRNVRPAIRVVVRDGRRRLFTCGGRDRGRGPRGALLFEGIQSMFGHHDAQYDRVIASGGDQHESNQSGSGYLVAFSAQKSSYQRSSSKVGR